MGNHDTKYIFVTGGVLSGVGKGITAASIGAVLKARGLNVSIQKCDPYLNVDAGTLNPAEHGECFVTDDGAETDLDLGHYERFLDINLSQKNATLSGRLLKELIEDERAGKFLGRTVQLVPHLTGKIQQAITAAAKGSDVHIVEIGGTVGDYEALAYLEAIRELAAKVGRAHTAFVHVVYVPYLAASKEFKTKPAQNAVNDLRGFGVSPDVVVARTDQDPKNNRIQRKLSLFTGLLPEAIIALPNADTVYRVPLTIEASGLGELLTKRLGLKATKPKLKDWQKLISMVTAPKLKTIKVAIIAKYLDNEDTYFSVIEALKTAAWHQKVDLVYDWINAEELSQSDPTILNNYDGILVPGGFGERGLQGKIVAAEFALKNNKPYLGLCLGLQMAVIAAARLGGLKTATSSEISPNTKTPVIYIMNNQKGKQETGGTMRLGAYPAKLKPNSLAAKIYGTTKINERHRHRFEVNRKFEKAIKAGGLIISGQSPDGRLVEMVEAPKHNFFIATQAHPELKSRPHRPHPLFAEFIKAAKL